METTHVLALLISTITIDIVYLQVALVFMIRMEQLVVICQAHINAVSACTEPELAHCFSHA
jgi:hypothetical protein